MAKRITSGKRDREKAKQEKRQEKQRRKELRQSGTGPSSFEEMLAYVDENGNLHSSPLDIKPKEEINVDTISISVPKQTDVEEETVTNKGQVSYFNSSKGYGFIKEEQTHEQYFFHISSAPSTIGEGDKVTFETERGPRGIVAINISIN